MAPVDGRVVHLRRDGTSVVVDLTGAVPAILHWGRDLGTCREQVLVDLVHASTPPHVFNGVPDVAQEGGLVAQYARGHLGVPTVEGHRDGRAFSPLFTLVEATHSSHESHDELMMRLVDDGTELAAAIELQVGVGGLVRMRATVTNVGDTDYQVDALVLQLPVPSEATELLDYTGRWIRERSPQRHAFTAGTHVRESRDARGHDASLLFAAGEAGFASRSGQVWAVHLAWSGNTRLVADHRMPSGTGSIGGGELLLPGEMRLAPGTGYESPWLLAAHGTGLDEVSGRFHDWLRARPSHPGTPRKVLLNVWEAVYFDHDLDRLRELATLAAEVGIERYVLDDGWFLGRRDDTAGLGDWTVDPQVWTDGLAPLIDHVTRLGMDFGIWVEPEMVNPDSELYRAHSDWVLQVPGREPMLARNQAVLDLGIADARKHVHDQLDDLLSNHDIAFVKWDHNRALVDAGSQQDGTAGVHAQTLAVYDLLASLRARHPAVEFESCASGGGRVDLGIMAHADRVWASDTIDALERQQIDPGTMRLLPPELVGSHVGSGRDHTTGRRHDLDFRAVTALFGHMGVEWDLAGASQAQRDRLAAWIDLHKTHRDLLHTGRMVQADHPDPALRVHGVVAHDRREAIFGIVQRSTSVAAAPGRVRLPGLQGELTYRVNALGPGRVVPERGARGTWWPGPVHLSGAVLGTVGIQVPAQHPEHAVLLHLDASTA